MGIQRKTLFGFPVPQRPASVNTVRLVPLTQGVQLGTAWPTLAPGSSTSQVNFLPIDGALVPRSRLSSLNTIQTLGPVVGLAELLPTIGSSDPDWWCSAATRHGVMSSNGSISVASFVSAFGLGVAGLPSALEWQYTPAFSANLNDNMLIAAGTATGPSYNTLLCLYHTVDFTSAPRYSYLTGAPRAKAVGNFDNYVVAFNTTEATIPLQTRVRWCVRGNPSNWTSEGSGFEDLLAMSGIGMAVRGTADGRLLLFSTTEIWYGTSATYPAQFNFAPLDKSVGCPFPRTIAETEAGILFLGSDLQLRLLPRGGGLSQPISGPMSAALRRQNIATVPTAHGVYDPYTKMYYLWVSRAQGTAATVGFVVNTQTGEWAFTNMVALSPDPNPPTCGIPTALDARSSGFLGEGLLFASGATVYSTNSLLAADKPGSGITTTVVATWRSAPIAQDLAGNYKQLTEINIDYRATSLSTLSLRISQDGGNTYEATGRTVTLPVARSAGRATAHVYIGGFAPTIELNSTSTGFELHRVDVGMNIGGRR